MNYPRKKGLFSRLLCGLGFALASLTASAQSSSVTMNTTAFALLTFDQSNVTILVNDGGQSGIYTGNVPWTIHANTSWSLTSYSFSNVSSTSGNPLGWRNNAHTSSIPWTAGPIPSGGDPGITQGFIVVTVGDVTHPLTLDTPVQTVVRNITVTVTP